METEHKIQHFGVWIKKTPTMHINREYYALVDKVSSTWSPRIGELRKSSYETIEKRKKYYDDDECRVYSDEWCEAHREKCLKNYDLNMAFFQTLQHEDFEKVLSKLLKSNKKIRQVIDLDSCKGVCGIYIMVLDEYKQMYIGQASDIKKRILKHWSTKKPFDRLIFGRVENSILSIDSFGALDTTRIFILETYALDANEKMAVGKVPSIYKLNRIGGGRPTDVFDTLEVLANSNYRTLTIK